MNREYGRCGRAEEKLLNSIDRSVDDFFSTNPTNEEIVQAKKALSDILLDERISVGQFGIRYALSRLCEMENAG